MKYSTIIALLLANSTEESNAIPLRSIKPRQLVQLQEKNTPALDALKR